MRSSTRPFLAHGCTVQVPDDWADLSSYAFRGPEDRDAAPVITVSIEEGLRLPDVERFARPRLQRALAAASGARLLREQRTRLAGGEPAVAAELRWFTPDGKAMYRRLRFALAGSTGFVLAATLSRRGRLTRGPEVERVLAGFRALPAGAPAARLEPGHVRYDRFSLPLPEGWSDESTVLLSEPDAKRFRRTLVLRRELFPERPPDDAVWMEEELKVLEQAVEGFELIRHRETAAADTGAAQLVEFHRGKKKDERLRQTELLAWRGGARYTLVVTTEPEPPAEVERRSLRLLRSFRAAAGAAP